MKKQAEDIARARSRRGADFAELATKYSEDEASKTQGRRPRLLRQGQMVPEFDEVAFSLQPGQISDLVKTQFGYHIIKVTDKKPATTQVARRGARADRGSAQVGARADRGAADRGRRRRAA